MDGWHYLKQPLNKGHGHLFWYQSIHDKSRHSPRTDRLVGDGEEAWVRYVDERAWQGHEGRVEQRPGRLSTVSAVRRATVQTHVDRNVDWHPNNSRPTARYLAVVWRRPPQVSQRRKSAGSCHLHRVPRLYINNASHVYRMFYKLFLQNFILFLQFSYFFIVLERVIDFET